MEALIIAAMSYSVLLLSKNVRKNSKLRAALFLGLSLHHMAAYYNSNIALLPGADGDAQLFYDAAAAPQDTYRYHNMAYTQFLMSVFSVTGPSQMLGSELSILAYSGSCLLILEILKILKRESFATPVLLLYGILPSPTVHFSITLRESYQALSLLAIVTGTLKLKRSFSPQWIGAITSGLYCLVIIHKSLKGMALGLAGLTLFTFVQKLGKGVTMGAGILLLAALASGPGSFVVDESDVSNQIESIHEYREGVLYAQGRAFYGGQIETDSISSFATSAPKVFLLYMTAPYPGQISGLLDIYSFLENGLRLILIFFAVRYWRKDESSTTRESAWYILAAYLLTEAAWSMGTGNWGTALRHHSVALALPIILGVPAILDKRDESAHLNSSPQDKKTTTPKDHKESIRGRRRRIRQKVSPPSPN